MSSSWFTDLTGMASETRDTVSKHLRMEEREANDDDTGTGSVFTMVSDANGKRFGAGCLSLPRLSELRNRTQTTTAATTPARPISIREVVGDVQTLHADPANAGAIFQVASQFNMLEMVSPQITPEHGVGIYEKDHTQGPACAIACGAGTIFRNYFVPMEEQGTARVLGQTRACQLNGLGDVEASLDNEKHRFWKMKNGYVIPEQPNGLGRVAAVLNGLSTTELAALEGALRVGLHKDVEVTLPWVTGYHTVTQVYCSAMPVAYSVERADAWEPLACLVLNAAYEATLRIACQNVAETGNNKVFLTLLGGGAFGNRGSWIVDAAIRALQQVQGTGLEIVFVSYSGPSPIVSKILSRWQEECTR